MKLYKKSFRFLTVLSLLMGLAALGATQESVAWHLPFRSPSGPGYVVPESTSVDESGNAYVAYQSNIDIHLSEVSSHGKTIFDSTIAQGDINPLQFLYSFYWVYGSKYSQGTSKSSARITVLAENISYVGMYAYDSIWINQFDPAGKPLWAQPFTVYMSGYYGFDVDPDGTVYLACSGAYGKLELITVANTGAASEPLVTRVEAPDSAQRLPNGDWFANGPMVYSFYPWAIINGKTGLLTLPVIWFDTPPNSVDSFLTVNNLPDGNVLVVYSWYSTVDLSKSFECFIYSAGGTLLDSGPVLSGNIYNVNVGPTGATIYLLGQRLSAGKLGNFVEAISEDLAIHWADDVNFSNGWAVSDGLYLTSTTNPLKGFTTNSLIHFNLNGDLDWQTSYASHASTSAISCLTISGQTTYLTVTSGAVDIHSVGTGPTDFDLVRLVSGPTISSFSATTPASVNSPTTFGVGFSSFAPAGGYQVTLTSNNSQIGFIQAGQHVQTITVTVPEGRASAHVPGYFGNPKASKVTVTADFNGILRYLTYN